MDHAIFAANVRISKWPIFRALMHLTFCCTLMPLPHPLWHCSLQLASLTALLHPLSIRCFLAGAKVATDAMPIPSWHFTAACCFWCIILAWCTSLLSLIQDRLHCSFISPYGHPKSTCNVEEALLVAGGSTYKSVLALQSACTMC